MQEDKELQNKSDERLFEKMNEVPHGILPVKKLQRSKNNVIAAGVCAGVAEYLNIDTATVRLIALLTLLLGGWSVIAYLLTAFLLPVDQNPKQLTGLDKNNLKKENLRTLVGGLLILTGFHFALLMFGIGSRTRIFILSNDFIFPAAAMISGVYLLISKRFEDQISTEKIPSKYFRSRSDKLFFGVCGGLAKYIGVDSLALRIIFIILTLLTLGLFALVFLPLAFFSQSEMEEDFE